jgi:hypothetical protein
LIGKDIQQKSGNYILVIDNNSGTYSPPKEMVSKLADLFRLNFPDLAVEAYDREDPVLKEYKRIVSEVK